MNELHNPKRELHRRASCANNLKQIGFSLKLAPVSILLLGIATFLPLAAPAQSSDGTDQFLLQVAAPNRTVGSDDRPNVLFIIVDDLNVALGSYLDSAPHPHYATAKTPPDDTKDIPDPASEIYKDDASHTDRQKKQAIAAYHAMVTMIDSYVGELLDALKLLELDNSTIVVFTSDHGFHLN